MTRLFGGGRFTEISIKTKRKIFEEKLFSGVQSGRQYIVDILRIDRLYGSRGTLYYFMDMELCRMDLQMFINTPDPDVESNIWKIMLQIASGVKFVHEHGLVIRDLVPSRGIVFLDILQLINQVLYSTKVRGVWKLGDFSLVASPAPTFPDQYSIDPSRAGTDGYRAPELIQEGHFTNKVDIWAMGCILYTLINSESLFRNNGGVLEYVQRESAGEGSPEVIKLNLYLAPFTKFADKLGIRMTVNGMFAVQPDDRPSAEDLIKNAFDKLVRSNAPSINQ